MEKLAAVAVRGLQSINWPVCVAMVAALCGAVAIVDGVYLLGGCGWAMVVGGVMALGFAVLVLRGLNDV